MADTTTERLPRDGTPEGLLLPDDVADWVREVLHSDEDLAACLLADIAPDGEFAEHWTFLTNRRVLVLSPDGTGEEAEVVFEMPLEEVQGAEIRDYVGSSALILKGKEEARELARFSLGSHHEASDLCHYVNAVVEQREEGKPFEEVEPPVTRRPEHRCSKCGRALSRWSEVCSNCIDRRQIMVRLFSYVLPYKWLALLGLGLTLTITGIGLAPPYLGKVLLDSVITQGNLPLLWIVVVVLVGVHTSSALLMVFRTYLMQWLGNRVLFDMRVRLYDHLQMLRLRFYTQRQTGRIMSRVTSDLQRLQYFISEGFQEMLVAAFTMVLIAGILVVMNPLLFVLTLAPVPIIAVSTYLFGHRMHLLYHRLWRRYAGLNAILTDTIPGIRVVKSFAQEERESERFSDHSADLFNQEMQAVKLYSGFFPLVQLLTALGSILIFSVGGYMAATGRTTPGVLFAFIGYLWRFYEPIRYFGRLSHRLQHCITSAERVFQILDSDPEPLNAPGVELEPMQGEVEFRNVRFSYEPGKYALDDVSFHVEPGEMIGLVGPSGAGKSTLVHLIARFYDVDEGQILIDGHDIQDLALRHYREKIGVVLQEPYLFHGSVWSNVAYANPQASPDDIIRAAKAANAHEFIVRLPDGYDTVIGERGQTLSGGERQRISIARAVLRDPTILILDEATASVDTETEAMIQAALERLIENRTTFAIAHRLSTLRKAHRLVVLERGHLIEIGTHDELIESGGLYSRLCKLQSELSKMRAW
jgi:ATP-binding cassette subfamily B protein